MVSGRATRRPSYALVPAAHSARIVSIAVSSRSRRSAGGGNGSPNARCSRSHQPAPTPQKARPPESASRVATVLAVMPGGRKVTGRDQGAEPQPGVQAGEQAEGDPGLRDRLPGACRPAGSGSGGPSARAPRSPASSAASATSRSQPAGSSPHGNRETWRTTSRPSRRGAGAAGPGWSAGWSTCGAPARARVGPGDHDVPALARQPVRDGTEGAAAGRPAPGPGPGGRGRRCGAGRRPGACRRRPRPPAARAPGPARGSRGAAPASRPRVSTTVVRPRRARPATIRSSRANASAEASRSWRPLPTTPRRSSEETISAAR